MITLCANGQTEFKVITFNIRSFEPEFDVTPYAKHLVTEDADFICLNEVENRSLRQKNDNNYRDVVQELAGKLNMFGTFGYAYNLNNKKQEEDESKYTYCRDEMYGNAILSRYPLLGMNAVRLPRPEGSADQRGVLVCDFLLPSGETIRVACTHLDHIGGQMEQAQVLISNTVIDPTIPTILTGDMNKGLGSDVINTIEKKYERLDSDEVTYSGISKIDFIFGTKNQWELIDTKVMSRFYGDMELSDHCPVVSTVRLK